MAASRRSAAGLFGALAAVAAWLPVAAAYQPIPLPYAYDALEPAIDNATMHFHHDNHYMTYINNIVKAFETAPAPPLVKLQSTAIKNGTAFRNNGGGVYNHNLYWLEMAPKGTGGEPSRELAAALTATFGSMADFQTKLAAAGTSRFGSGWAWLIVDKDRKLDITSTPNQDNPLMEGVDAKPGIPILALDVWEHAYYLKYQYRRADYIKAWWDVVNWKQVSEWYADALHGKAPSADRAPAARAAAKPSAASAFLAAP